MGSFDRCFCLAPFRLPLMRRARLSLFSGLALCSSLVLLGADRPSPPSTPHDPALLQSLTRSLEEEVKLAVKPQPYLVLDLAAPALLLKSRGLALRSFPILDRRSRGDQLPVSTHRLRARPPVSRPTIQPGQDSTEHPIAVSDMPMEFLLAFDHGLVIEVMPPLAERPWHWFKRKWLNGWSRVKAWVGQEQVGEFPDLPPRISLILSHEDAQALAWTVTEGMPLLIGRVEFP